MTSTSIRIAGLAAVLTLGVGGASRAAILQFTDPAQLSAQAAFAVPDGGAAGQNVAAPLMVTAGGNTATFTSQSGGFFLFNSTGQGTGFADNTPLLNTLYNGNTTGPLTITFDQGVQAFGLSAQDFAQDTETFTVTLAHDGASLGQFTVGPVDNSTDASPAAFLGAETTGDSITSILISSQSSQPGFDDNFLVGPVQTGVAATPEPSSLAVLGLGLLAITGLAARRRAVPAG